jgi:hypothetical protein
LNVNIVALEHSHSQYYRFTYTTKVYDKNKYVSKFKFIKRLACRNHECNSYARLLLILSGDIHPNPGPLKVCLINARSLVAGTDTGKSIQGQYSKIDEINVSIIQLHNPDIISVTETWLNNAILNIDLTIPGYNIYRKDRNRQGGGILVYVKDHLSVIHRKEMEPNDVESLVIQCNFGSKSVLISSWYRPPNQNVDCIDRFIENFSWSVNSSLSENHSMFVCLGDFNDRCIDWNNDHDRSELGNKLRDCIKYLNLYQMVTECTRITEHSAYLLDLCITDSPAYVTKTYTLDEIGNLDHKPVIAEFNYKYVNNRTMTREVWHYNNGDYQSFNSDITDIDWNDILVENDINLSTEQLTEKILQLAEQHIPKRTVHSRTKDKLWFNGRIKKLIRIRNRWNGTYNRTKLEVHKATRDVYRKLVKIEIEKAKLRHTESLIRSLSDPKIQCKKYWTIVRELYGNKVKVGIPTLKDNGRYYCTDMEKANLLCDYFTDKCSLPLPPAGYRLPEFHFVTNARLGDVEISEETTMKRLSKLNVSKANGPDKISNRLLRECATSLAHPLSRLFRISLDNGEYPASWKLSNSSPVYKKDDDSCKDNYRPISLLSCISKVFEKTLFDPLYKFCVDNNLLTERNSGFKQLDSTVNQLVHITHSIYQGLDAKQNVCSVFLDISKAFDRVYHKGLIFKLKQLGITGNLLSLLTSYLDNRYHRVVVNGQCSEWKCVKAGVPQGSILGPLLFLIYINDIIDNINSNIYLFADDTSLMRNIDQLDIQGSFDSINDDLQKLHEWSLQWRVDFNAKKSCHLILTKQTNPPDYPTIYMGNTEIRRVNAHKHLGIIFSSDMTWSDHVNSIRDKAMRRTSSLKRISYMVPRKTLIHLYKSIIRPVLEYGCVVFDNIDQRKVNTLESVQRNAGLICTNGYKSTSHNKLLRELGWQKLETRRTVFRLLLLYKIMNNQTPNYLKRLMPLYVQERSHYQLRNSTDLSIFNCRLSCYYRSYFPKSVREWNTLNNDLRECQSLSVFRRKLKGFFFTNHVNPIYMYGSVNTCNNMSRMRMGLSPIREHLYKINIVESAVCQLCNNNENEDITHFFLHCSKFDTSRIELFSEIINVISPEIIRNMTESELTNNLLFGFEQSVSNSEKEFLYKEVLKFVTATKRFTDFLYTNTEI